MTEPAATEPTTEPTTTEPTATLPAAIEPAVTEPAAAELDDLSPSPSPSPSPAEAGVGTGAGAVSAAEVEAERLPAGSGRRTLVGLGAVTAGLLVVTLLLGIGWLRTSDQLAARDRTVAAQATEREHLQDELNTVRAQQAALQTKLAQVQAQVLDPVGYQHIKDCVRQYAQMERSLQKVIADLNAGKQPTAPAGEILNGSGPTTFTASTTCADAEPYLK